MSINIMYILLSVCGIILLTVYYKEHHIIKGVFLTALQGICAFFAVNFVGSFFSVHLNLNIFSAVLSTLGGTPGVIFLLLMNIITSI